MEPQFPLDPRNPPTCRKCGKLCTKQIVTPRNQIGNQNRPYYSCNDGHERIFSTWDDSEGITNGNPPCRCGFTSRRDTNRKGEDFFACPNRFNRGCGWSMTCDDQLAILPQPNSIPVAVAIPQYGAQYPFYAAQLSAQYDHAQYYPHYGPQHGSQYGSQNRPGHFPQHFPQQFPPHASQNGPPQFPPQSVQHVSQYIPQQFPQQSPQYGSQNGPAQFPQHFSQQFPQHLSQNMLPQFPQHVSQHAPRQQTAAQFSPDIPQYRDSRTWASAQVPVNDRGRSCCLLM